MISLQKDFIHAGAFSALSDGTFGGVIGGTGASESTHSGLLDPIIVNGILTPPTESDVSLPDSQA